MKSGSNLEKILRAGNFAFTGELGPPRGTNVAVVREKAKHLVGMVDAELITPEKLRELADRISKAESQQKSTRSKARRKRKK